jgi:hypothetical protein
LRFVCVDDACDGTAGQHAETFGSDPDLVAWAIGHDDVRGVMGLCVLGGDQDGGDRVQSETGSKPKMSFHPGTGTRVSRCEGVGVTIPEAGPEGA